MSTCGEFVFCLFRIIEQNNVLLDLVPSFLAIYSPDKEIAFPIPGTDSPGEISSVSRIQQLVLITEATIVPECHPLLTTHNGRLAHGNAVKTYHVSAVCPTCN